MTGHRRINFGPGLTVTGDPDMSPETKAALGKLFEAARNQLEENDGLDSSHSLVGIAVSGLIIGVPIGMLFGRKLARDEFIQEWEDDWEEDVPEPVKNALRRLGEDQILEARIIK